MTNKIQKGYFELYTVYSIYLFQEQKFNAKTKLFHGSATMLFIFIRHSNRRNKH